MKKAFHVTTFDRTTSETFTYQVVAENERAAKSKIIAGMEAGSKKGSTIYEVLETKSLF